METRSRKRAEASTSSPISGSITRSNKRSRVSSTALENASAIATRTRTRAATAQSASMDPNSEPLSASGSTPRGRRGKNSGIKLKFEKDNVNSEKGKEKEPEIRHMETERSSALNIESHDGGEDDNDSEGGGGIFHQNLTSASSALQGLLRKLGAGLDDLLPSTATGSASSSHQNGRLKKVLSGLRADGEEGRQVEALLQLCEILSIGTEESLSTFSVDSFVPVLVGLLNHESNPDIMLLAARALTHLVDVLPSSCSAVVHYGAVSCFVARLLTIEYMDLAEQSLLALNKISQEHPTACLQAGALMAVLSYLDFFSTGVQRVALATAAIMCKKLPSNAADFVMEAVPLLTNLLQYHDAMVLESASICLTRIAEVFSSSPEKLDKLCNHGLVTQAATLISSKASGGSQSLLSTSTYTGLIQLLSICARGSPLGAKSLLLLGISGILKDILSGSDVMSSMSFSPALSRPPEQIFEIVNLANELLPPLPLGTVTLPVCSLFQIRGSSVRKSHAGRSDKQEGFTANPQEASTRVKMLTDQPELLQQFGVDLLPVMVQIYGSSVTGPVRYKCLSVIGKLMYFSPPEMIKSLINETNISSFLAGVLAWKDPQVLVPTLQISEILLEKLPDTFSKMFVREGVVHAVDALIKSGSLGTSQPSGADKYNDSIVGSSPRTRRSRRRVTTGNIDVGSADNSKNPKLNLDTQSNPFEVLPSSAGLRATVSASAQAFKEKYFPSDPKADYSVTSNDLVQLKNLSDKLIFGTDEPKSKSKGKSKAFGAKHSDVSFGKEENLIEVICEILRELSKGEGVSTFEFIGSDVIDALLNYLTFGLFTKEKISDANLPKLRQQAIRRYQYFISIALPSSVDEQNANVPMSILVQKLQSALSSLERFPVLLNHVSRSGGNSGLSSGLSGVTRPVKLRLCRAQGEKSLRDYSSNIILIDPLASLAAVEDFLWPRVQRSDSSQKSSGSAGNSDPVATPASPSASTAVCATRHHSARLRSSIHVDDASIKTPEIEENLSSSKGKGKALMKPTQEELRGPQTRNTARRRAALDKENDVKAEEGDTPSEGDELDMSPVEIDEALVIEEDEDISDDDEDEDEDEDDDDEVDEDAEEHDEDDADVVLGDYPRPIYMGDIVHDVKFGDPVDDDSAVASANGQSIPTRSSSTRASTEFQGGSPFGSRGATSFAATAMAGLSSSNNRGGRGSSDHQGRPLSANDSPRLVFTAGGRPLNRHLTIYQAIQRQLAFDEDDDDRSMGSDILSGDGIRLWSDIHTITYKRVDGQAERSSLGALSSTNSSKTPKTSASDKPGRHITVLDSILLGELPCDMERSNPIYNILALLRALEGLNQLAPRLRVLQKVDSFAKGKVLKLDNLSLPGVRVPSGDFINWKLTPKLARQIQDPLAVCSGSLPSWCYQLTKSCPFLFPFEIRRQYFYSTAFRFPGALNRLHQQHPAGGHGYISDRHFRSGRALRQKVRVSRNRILESAMKVMEMYYTEKFVLEVEYFGEVGTGLGPTLEFYTLLSHELQKAGLCMWRLSSPTVTSSIEVDVDGQHLGTLSAGTDQDFIHAPLGLFPRPWPPNADTSDGSKFSKVLEYNRLLGRVMAKALQDGRLLDLPLSTAFFKLILGQELDLQDIASFDLELWTTLQEMQALVHRKEYLDSCGGCNPEELLFRGTPVEDLYLDFSLPGYPDYILKPDSENVDLNTLGDYVSRVVDATVGVGIMRQVEALRSGFNQVFDISSLQIFSPNELDYLLCGQRELWKADMLADLIKFDHGFTSKSPAIINLLEIMGEFTLEQQRAFCQFVTGAPRLPPGGLAMLNPKLTIVRKHSSNSGSTGNHGSAASESADDDLPSVMTCANYLKLPPYSTKEIMYKKLLYAIYEGQGSFDLS